MKKLFVYAVAGAFVALTVAPAAAGAAPPLPVPKAGSCVPPGDAADPAASDAYDRVSPGDAWPLTRGKGVTVAVVDSGVSARASGMTGAVAHGTDVVNHGTADSDCAGRGTALAALIAARPVDGSALTGVAPAVRILPVRVLTKDGNVPAGDLAKGIRAAVGGGAQVILVGGGTVPSADLRDAVASAAAHDVLVVASVGTASVGTADNGGGTAVLYPATDPSVLAVGGLDHTGAPTESVNARVDLSAPAENVVTEGPSGVGNYTISGAPAAAAYVAGAAALVRSYWPRLTAGQVRDRLIATATPLVGFTGHRELDVYSAVTSTDAGPPVQSAAHPAVWPVVPPGPGVPDGTRIAAIVTSCAAAFTAAGFIAVHGLRARRRRLAV